MKDEKREEIERLEKKRDIVVKVMTFAMMGHLDKVPMSEFIEVLSWALRETTLRIHDLTLEEK